MANVYRLSGLSPWGRVKISEVLEEKGVPNTHNAILYRTDSDAYSRAFAILQSCPDDYDVFEIRNGSDDVHFWFYRDEEDLVRKFARAETFLDFEGDLED